MCLAHALFGLNGLKEAGCELSLPFFAVPAAQAVKPLNRLRVPKPGLWVWQNWSGSVFTQHLASMPSLENSPTLTDEGGLLLAIFGKGMGIASMGRGGLVLVDFMMDKLGSH